MSVRSQSAFLRKAGTLTVWLIIFCIYFLGVYNYVQIRNDTAVSMYVIMNQTGQVLLSLLQGIIGMQIVLWTGKEQKIS